MSLECDGWSFIENWVPVDLLNLLGVALRRASNSVVEFWHEMTLYICRYQLLFGVNEKLRAQHILGPVTRYKLLYVSNQGRAGARAKG